MWKVLYADVIIYPCQMSESMTATLGLKQKENLIFKFHFQTLIFSDSDPDYDHDQDHEQYKNTWP